MTLETFGTWVVLGLLTGWLAGFVMKDGGHGRISDLLLGLAGSGIVNTFASSVGALSEAGRVAMAVVSVAGTAFVIVSQRKVWPALA
jgi:uncharacterized membrane protein YeaQ/YmgE (transglycosylase-associated protein family)